MAEEKSVELDDDGKPIVKEPDESGGPPLKTKDDTEIEPDGKPDGEEEPDEPEVPVRKSVQQHIIARQQDTIKKLRSKQEDEVEPIEDPGKDEDLTPEAQSVVAREVKRAVAPIIQTLVNQADESELQELFETEPEAKDMSKQIRAYMKHPSYKGVPPEVIYHHLAFDKALGGTVKRKTAADREALHQKGGGSTRRPKENLTGDIPDVNELDDKEFEELQHKAITGKFVEKE